MPTYRLNPSVLRKGLVAAIIVCYALSLALPAFPGKKMDIPGWWAFIFAATGGGYFQSGIAGEARTFEWLLLVGWLPNPLLWIGLASLWRTRYGWAATCGWLSALVALMWVAHVEWTPLTDSRHHIGPITTSNVKIGYWLWVSACALLATSGSACLVWKRVRQRRTPSV